MFMTSKSTSYWGHKRGKGLEPQKAGCSLLMWMVASTSGWGGHPIPVSSLKGSSRDTQLAPRHVGTGWVSLVARGCQGDSGLWPGLCAGATLKLCSPGGSRP